MICHFHKQPDIRLMIDVVKSVYKTFSFLVHNTNTDDGSHQKRCPQRLITASLAVSRHILHSKVLSWLPLSAAVELLDPGIGFSVAAVDPTAGGGAAVAI